MLITRIELENIKSYHHVIIDFQRGTTAISGANGAGKTTLVEAIGFALFDHLSYKQEQFVREGEKFGRVIVYLIGNDDRPYEVERRCGTSAHWMIYDREADARLEQRADVLDKLHELFGVDRERSLENLFRDALGVPQGTFTAIFLEAPRIRKQTFGSLLQIEDYETAFKYLLEVQKEYKDQWQVQENEIQRLTIETRDLEAWRAALKQYRQEEQAKTEENVQATRRLAEQKAHAEVLKQRRDDLQQRKTQLERHKMLHTNAQDHFQRCEQDLQSARVAQQAIENSQADYLRYLQAEDSLKLLRQDERERNTLRQRQATLNSTLATTEANITNIQKRLDEVATAHQRLVELLPLVDQQYELEKQRELLTQQVHQYEGLVKEGRRLHQLRTQCIQQQEKFERSIAEIEPLQDLADLLTERVEHLARLQAMVNERNTRRLQLEEKRGLLQEKRDDLERTAANLRKAEDAIAKIEAHRQEAEEYPTLQEQHTQLALQQHRLQGNIEGYTRSRQLSAGGQCPLLHQPCLNIKQVGMVSLESYFDGLLAEEEAQLNVLAEHLDFVDERSARFKKYADALDRLGQFIERRDGYAEHIRGLRIDITRAEREVNDLEEEWEALKLVEKQIEQARAGLDESKKADAQIRQLDGFRKQLQQVQAQIEQHTADFEERRQLADQLRGSAAQLKGVEQEINELDDPRAQSKAQQQTIKHEATYQEQLRAEQQRHHDTQEQLQSLQQQLAAYADLDVSIGEQEAIRHQCAASHRTYLQNERTARLLPERERAYQEAVRRVAQSEQALSAAQEAHDRAAAAFDEQEFRNVENDINRLGNRLSALAAEMSSLQKEITGLEQRIQHAETLLVELENAQKEKHTLEELTAMAEQFRKLIREAAPHVLKAMLNDISAEANRIFGEIMGDRSGQLAWQNDYEITVQRQGVSRSFAQLSGGEQMSAALAVRLALLKKLSTINIAFFDEPTQNMDGQRRTNLAEQIRRVRGFDQLIVISHDDTFEQGLDSLIRLRKTDGQSRLWSEEDNAAIRIAPEQEKEYAS